MCSYSYSSIDFFILLEKCIYFQYTWDTVFCFCCLVFCFVLFFFWFWILVFLVFFDVVIILIFIFHNLYCYSKTDRQITTFSRTLKNTSWCHVLMYIYIYRYTKYTHTFFSEKKKRMTLQHITSCKYNGVTQILIQRRYNSLMIIFFKVFRSKKKNF